MLRERGLEFRYREYTEEPLSEGELGQILETLGVGPREVLRGRDAKKLGLSGDESDAELISLMASHPVLLQRPIVVREGRAVVCRPLELLEGFLEG